MSLSNEKRQQFKAQAHSLKPVVLLGAKGLTDAVLAEIDQALEHHELIKVKLSGQDKEARQTLANTIAEQTHCDVVGHIGQVVILYRKQTQK